MSEFLRSDMFLLMDLITMRLNGGIDRTDVVEYTFRLLHIYKDLEKWCQFDIAYISDKTPQQLLKEHEHGQF